MSHYQDNSAAGAQRVDAFYFEDDEGRVMSLRFSPQRSSKPFYFGPAS